MLSVKAKSALRIAIANKDEATEVLAELDKIATGGGLAPLGTTTDIAASNFTAAIAADPTKAEIDAGIDVISALIEARLDDIEAKVDALIAALS